MQWQVGAAAFRRGCIKLDLANATMIPSRVDGAVLRSSSLLQEGVTKAKV